MLSSYAGNYRASSLWVWSSLVTGYKDLSLPMFKWGQQRCFPSSSLCLGEGMCMTWFPCPPYPTYPCARMPVCHPDSRILPAPTGLSCPRYVDWVPESSCCLSCFVEVTKSWETVVWLTQGLGANQFLTCFLTTSLHCLVLVANGLTWALLPIYTSTMKRCYHQQRQRTKACMVHRWMSGWRP